MAVKCRRGASGPRRRAGGGPLARPLEGADDVVGDIGLLQVGDLLVGQGQVEGADGVVDAAGS
ncbi:hypothetical protein [Actinomyces denticolens]|uniref:hypothetical protein n=1 Tax=Actinomyces denticolens TaxID=52767 RepID=UPI001FC98D0A|nr:hypothetical protein [Actinomyces denticolens]